MVKSLKIVPKWETCSSILRSQSNTKQHALVCKVNHCQLLKIEDHSSSPVLPTAFRGNDCEASFLNGADHASAGLSRSKTIIVAIRKY